MSDYSKQTVAQLRQLLKDRGIPSTGLTRKAQIVEKLEEADQSAGGDALEPEAAPADDDAPPAEVAQPVEQTDSPPMTIATLDGNRENVSHIDSEAPAPDQMQAIETSAEDTTTYVSGAIQPAAVFSAAPADPDDVVGPKITEPTDEEAGDKTVELAQDELPDAPGPAAEALCLMPQHQELSTNALEDADEDNTSTPVTVEEPSIEKAELLTIPERSTADTSRLNTEELESDTKKRKRRSGSPDMSLQDIRVKKPRPSQEPAPEIHLKEDDDVVMEQGKPERSNGAHVDDVLEAESKPAKKEKTDRYKNLVQPSLDANVQDALQDDRPVSPALHPATPALYIRNFMRPLRPEPLRAHLVSLASPPSSSPDASIVKSLFLDAMKTHALVLFSNTTAASRVRASLHGSIWPPEGNRKELWVDFIPDDSVEDWIKQEEDAITAEKEGRAAGHPISAKRFEVVYPDNNTAVFQEVGLTGSNAPPDAPRGPRGSTSTEIRRPSQPVAPTQDTRQDIEASFKTLDQLFSSTTAKPNLYFLPVSDETSEARLKDLGLETARDWAPGETRKGRGLKTEMKYKYSFDGEDRVVEIGEDRGPWAEDYRGGRGRGGGSGFRGRGGRGRGSGIGWRG